MAKRCCAACVYACGVRLGPPEMLVCANCREAPGELTQVAPEGCCRRFRARRKPVVRLEPPEPPDEKTRLIPLTQRKFAMVDPADYEQLSQHKWYAMKVGPNYYACRHEGRLTILMHRQIMQPPDGMVVDHKNNNSLDNHRVNLRVCTQAQNLYNTRPTGAGSGYKGVIRNGDKWVFRVKHRGRTYRQGGFDDPAEAARARDRKAIELFGPYAWLNFPDAIGGRIVCVRGIIRVRARATGRAQVLRRGSTIWE